MLSVSLAILSLAYHLAVFRYVSALDLSPQGFNLPVHLTKELNETSSHLTVAGASRNLTLPPNPLPPDPFIFESLAGYKVVYTSRGIGVYTPDVGRRFIRETFAELDRQRRYLRLNLTDPLPGRVFQVVDSQLGPNLAWRIGQTGILTTESLSYMHVEIALQGMADLMRLYGASLIKPYVFNFYDQRKNKKLLAVGYLGMWRPRQA